MVAGKIKGPGISGASQRKGACKGLDLYSLMFRYLRSSKVLEYTLFQPGLFLNYLAYPYKTSRHLDPLQSVFDFHNCRAIMVDGHEDAIMTVTTVADLAVVVSRAVDHEGLWPAVMGIQGNRLTFSQIIEIARRVRGMFPWVFIIRCRCKVC